MSDGNSGTDSSASKFSSRDTETTTPKIPASASMDPHPKRHQPHQQDDEGDSRGNAQARSGATHSKNGECDDRAEELNNLRNQLRGSREECNVLLNTLEWKEVQWTNKVETLERERKVEIDELRQQYEAKVKEKLCLAEENEELRKKLEICQKQKLELEGRLKAIPTTAMSFVVGGLGLMRCPVRSLVGNFPSIAPEAAACYCQEIAWRILNAMQGVTALLCNVHDLQIFDASKSAHLTWGSALLHGQSILTLVNGPSRAAWLRRAFQVHQQIAESEQKETPGFVVRDLGCEEFTNKQGQVFDSSVITAHLPSEPCRSKGAAWLVIIEPQYDGGKIPQPLPTPSSSKAQPCATPSTFEQSRGWATQSEQSEVSSVDPSDSASNIFF